MSQHVQDLPAVRIRIQRPRLAWLVGLALAVAILTATMLIVLNDSSTNSQTSRAVQTSIGGPNEASRGASVATATAAPASLSTTRGVDETARGQAAASASR